ncbi:MAG: transposase, partial [Clostridiales bacterium]|nr:transposase [Clostridiales bacterium]
KFRISEDGKDAWEILITNLNRFEFPIERMKEMYHKRWDIETSFRSLKYALGGINFHSKKDEFIDMEIYAHLIMFNVVSACVNQVEVVHKNDYALDFKMACHLVRHYFHRNNQKPYKSIFDELLRYINPIRLGRQDKRKMKPKSAVWFVYRVA